MTHSHLFATVDQYKKETPIDYYEDGSIESQKLPVDPSRDEIATRLLR